MKPRSAALEKYAAKRDFARSKEPRPAVHERKPAQPMFVIQKHAARRLHYDFRLEMEGVLKSWAVPKGLPMSRAEKHLAMRVEDHPMDYARFEGIIAEGNYGAGTVMVWDIGTYEVHGVEPARALEEGKIHLTLHGKKLKGEWTLVKIKSPKEAGKDPWLMFKTAEDAPPMEEELDDQSALSQRSMKQIADDRDAEWESNRPAESATRYRPVPAQAHPVPAQASPAKARPSIELPPNLPDGNVEFIVPMTCQTNERPPAGSDWVYEIKFDGIRAIAVIDEGKVEMFSRLGNKVTQRFPEIQAALKQLPCRKAVLDGEVVALEESGRSSFQLLQSSQMPGEVAPIRYYLFDALILEGKNLEGLPLEQRKDILQHLIADQPEPLRFSASFHADLDLLLEQVRERGLEGLIAKKAGSKYLPGRRCDTWVKIKVQNSAEFVIGGFTMPKGTRSYFGSILVGYYENGTLMFASKVGSGFNENSLRLFHDRFKELEQPTCPFVNLPEKRGTYGGVTASEMRRCTWIRPEIVCEVRYTEWTRDGNLRHPVFLGIREDKKPEEVTKS